MNHLRIIQPSSKAKIGLLASGLAVFLVLLVAPFVARAQLDTVAEIAAEIIGFIAQAIASILGWLFLKISHVLINWIAPYDNFIGLRCDGCQGEHPVQAGWVLVRDISNMFFIIILLVIAFATIFKIEKYDYKKYVPRLLVMAVLINFSRTITGIVIDASQVAMLTFVNAFQAAAGGNLVTGLGIQNLFNVPDGAKAITSFSAAVSFIIADIILAIILVTMVVITVTLAYRIVTLWMVTILSPAAFLMNTFPRGEKYYADWWKKLIDTALQGPIIAFFLWLALATMANAGKDVGKETIQPIGEGEAVEASSVATQAAQEHNLVRLIIGVMMLLFGLQVAGEFGAAGANYALSEGKKLATGAAKAVGKFAATKSWAAAKTVPRTADYAFGIRDKVYGGRWSPVRALAPQFAQSRLSKLQEARGKAYEESQKTAKGVSANELVNLANRPLIPGAMNDAAYAGTLMAALSSPDVGNALKARGMNSTQILNQKREWMASLKSRAERSGNPSMLQAVRDQEKKNPLLIGNTADRIKAIQKMGGAQAIDLDADQLQDPEVFTNLTDKAKEYVRDRGSKAQVDALDAAESNPANIKDDTRRRARVQGDPTATPPTPPMSNADIAALTPEIQAQIFTDMDAAQRATAAPTLDVKSLTVEQLTAENGRFAAELAAIPAQRDAIANDSKLAAALQQGLQTYLRTPPPGAPPPTPALRTTAVASGVPVAAAFPGMAGLAAAVTGPGARDLLSGLNVSKDGEFNRDRQLQDIVTQNVDINVTLAGMAAGTPDERAIATRIATEIVNRGNATGASPAAVTRAVDVLANATLAAIVPP